MERAVPIPGHALLQRTEGEQGVPIGKQPRKDRSPLCLKPSRPSCTGIRMFSADGQISELAPAHSEPRSGPAAVLADTKSSFIQSQTEWKQECLLLLQSLTSFLQKNKFPEG